MDSTVPNPSFNRDTPFPYDNPALDMLQTAFDNQFVFPSPRRDEAGGG